MRVIIAGGSTFDSIQYMTRCLEPFKAEITAVISGRGYGADNLSEIFAVSNGLDLELYPANWGKYGKDAGYHRWLKVFENQNIDKVFLFWNGVSKGTKVLKDLAEKLDISYDMFYYEDTVLDFVDLK